jgi:hypothetical protein
MRSIIAFVIAVLSATATFAGEAVEYGPIREITSAVTISRAVVQPRTFSITYDISGTEHGKNIAISAAMSGTILISAMSSYEVTATIEQVAQNGVISAASQYAITAAMDENGALSRFSYRGKAGRNDHRILTDIIARLPAVKSGDVLSVTETINGIGKIDMSATVLGMTNFNGAPCIVLRSNGTGNSDRGGGIVSIEGHSLIELSTGLTVLSDVTIRARLSAEIDTQISQRLRVH